MPSRAPPITIRSEFFCSAKLISDSAKDSPTRTVEPAFTPRSPRAPTARAIHSLPRLTRSCWYSARPGWPSGISWRTTRTTSTSASKVLASALARATPSSPVGVARYPTVRCIAAPALSVDVRDLDFGVGVQCLAAEEALGAECEARQHQRDAEYEHADAEYEHATDRAERGVAVVRLDHVLGADAEGQCHRDAAQ